MKKLITILLAFTVVFSFAACSGSVPTEDVRGEQISNETTTADAEEEFSLGDTEGLTYENKFIGIGCTLDSDWTFYTDEQIMELNNITADLAGDEFQKAIKNAAVVYDMCAVSSNQMDNINVNLEKTNSLTLASLDLAENFENSFSIIKESFENMGFTDISHEIGTVKIDGEEFTAMNTTAQASGLVMYQTIISIKCNGYLANLTVTTYGDNTVDTILDKFYTIK